jgi:N6-adenosine-specific RNA methylase IME4
MADPFHDLPKGHFGAILCDPPWHFQVWKGAFSANSISGARSARAPEYNTMREAELAALPASELAATDCVLFMWVVWPTLEQSLRLIEKWGFKYKTCAFAWIKGDATQVEFFQEETKATMGLGYWTRANSEVCLLATRGKPKRLNADVRQGIIAPRREHSRKPDGIHERIERLVAGPYLELFARQKREGWTTWGNETDKFRPADSRPKFSEIWDEPFAAGSQRE